MTPAYSSPIGVFDSGIGGLSLLHALQSLLPHEYFIYYADNANAPYGEKSSDFIVERSLHIAKQLINEYSIKLLVVACNTATAQSIECIRHLHPDLLVVGIEPAIKPAALATMTKEVAVLATRRTLESDKFNKLLASQSNTIHFHTQPCDGLADAIERFDMPRVKSLIATYLSTLGIYGKSDNEIDTVVLGCTHYPLVLDEFRQFLGVKAVRFIDAGYPVAKRVNTLLTNHSLVNVQNQAPQPILLASGSIALLKEAQTRFINLVSNTK